MANKLNITKGDWKIRKTSLSNGAAISGVYASQNAGDTELFDSYNNDEIEGNSQLMCDAGNTYQSAYILPSELLQQRNELIDVCQRLLNNEINSNLKMERLIQKITQ